MGARVKSGSDRYEEYFRYLQKISLPRTLTAVIRKKRLELAGLREDIAFVSAGFELSERRACKLLGVDRASYRYASSPHRNARLAECPCLPLRRAACNSA